MEFDFIGFFREMIESIEGLRRRAGLILGSVADKRERGIAG